MKKRKKENESFTRKLLGLLVSIGLIYIYTLFGFTRCEWKVNYILKRHKEKGCNLNNIFSHPNYVVYLLNSLKK